MELEKSQVKFAKSKDSGEMIGFVSRHSKTKKLKGVREDSPFGKKICLLSEDLKGKVSENVLYYVELKQMHNGNGYVVVSAIPVKFKASIETVVIANNVYRVDITFGNKTIYYDPINGKSPSSRTIGGVLEIIKSRNDIENMEVVLDEFVCQAQGLLERLKREKRANVEVS